ncbi:MAG: DUF6636 domain-containing protein [Brevibacterium sp.]
MSIPPVPNHPPRPGRRKPAEESPDSITTQLFIGQDKSATADGSTQALSSEELERLRSMVASDGAEATEVLSLEELRQLAAAGGYGAAEEAGPVDSGGKPRKASSEDLAEAESASAPKQWNPQPAPWGSDFGAPGHVDDPAAHAGQPQSGRPQSGQPHSNGPQSGPPVYGSVGAADRQGSYSHPGGSQPPVGGPPAGAYPSSGHPGGGTYAAAYAGAGPGQPVGPGGPGGPAGPGGPYGPGGHGGPGGPGGPYRREPETKKVPAWLWVLAAIALILAVGIVGYIAWDSVQGNDETTSSAPSQEPSGGLGSEPSSDPTESSEAPVAEETFASPSGNIACTIDAERARCVIKDYDYSPPEKPDDCQLDEWGAIVVANNEGAGFSCVEAPSSNGPARVLGYGESITAQGMTCTSTEEGMTCKSDDSGIGFTVRRASVDFLE